MDALITLLKSRYQNTVNKIDMQFLQGICNYLDLFALPEIQAVLAKQKELPDGHYNKFLWSYDFLVRKVYEPMKKYPDLLWWKFMGFHSMPENRKGFYMLVIPPPFSFKAYFWDLPRHIYRLTDIHNKLIVLLENKVAFTEVKPVIKRFSFDSEKSILYLNEFEIPINRHGSITDQHRILAFMFKHDNLRQEFFYAEMSEEVFGDEYDKQPRRFWDNCELINEKVANDTKGFCPKLLIATLEKQGLVKINPDCWALFR